MRSLMGRGGTLTRDINNIKLSSYRATEIILKRMKQNSKAIRGF